MLNISCIKADIVPNEFHRTGAKSGKASRFLLSSKRAVSLFTKTSYTCQMKQIHSYLVGHRQLQHQRVQVFNIFLAHRRLCLTIKREFGESQVKLLCAISFLCFCCLNRSYSRRVVKMNVLKQHETILLSWRIWYFKQVYSEEVILWRVQCRFFDWSTKKWLILPHQTNIWRSLESNRTCSKMHLIFSKVLERRKCIVLWADIQNH